MEGAGAAWAALVEALAVGLGAADVVVGRAERAERAGKARGAGLGEAGLAGEGELRARAARADTGCTARPPW